MIREFALGKKITIYYVIINLDNLD